MPTTYEIKTPVDVFEAYWSGAISFWLTRHGKAIKIGDLIKFFECGEGNTITGREILYEVTYALPSSIGTGRPQNGLVKDTIAFQLKEVQRHDVTVTGQGNG